MLRKNHPAGIKSNKSIDGIKSPSGGVNGAAHQPKRRWPAWLNKILIGLAAALIVWWFWVGPIVQIKPGRYQAVFLGNGEIYFGKMSKLTNDYITLRDVYYLQSSTNAVAGKDSETKPDGDMRLIKRGKEVHGPEDKMMISQQQVLYWENLSDKNEVVRAIENYRQQQPTVDPVIQPGTQ